MKLMIKVLIQDGLSLTEVYEMSVKKFMFTMDLFFEENETEVIEEELTDDFLALF